MTETNPTPIAADLEADIERTRAELADTVDQLAARLDVKSRVRDRFVTSDGRPTQTAFVAGGVLALVIALAVVRGVRRKDHR
ncbi:hypothetical protein GCM10009795_061440 [Nocardioides hankookensis]|uniref:DUF3618 domain-containing protein n=1 Tax=Nocardioides hankookensis TaxID=443157 RepID=A0ABW1LPT4_9ACTN